MQIDKKNCKQVLESIDFMTMTCHSIDFEMQKKKKSMTFALMDGGDLCHFYTRKEWAHQ